MKKSCPACQGYPTCRGETTEALLGGFSHPLSLQFQGQLSLIPKIIETVIPKITYLWNFTIGGNFKELSDPLVKGPVIIYRLVGEIWETFGSRQ